MGRSTIVVVHNERTVYILIINEALFFGKSMDHSLINPNQIISFGIPVSDDPFVRTQKFGINHEDMFIPFRTEEKIALFSTYVPSNN